MTAPAEVTRSGRETYRDALVRLMLEDERVVCLDSDTGLFSGVDFGPASARYVNLGIAEQNMMGVAAGLARSGMVPFVNTMAAFASTRAVEAVKIDIAYAGLPVRIVATHAGLSAGHLGPTHHCLEDLAVMRLFPGMTVAVPADADAVESVLHQGMELPGPLYVRLGRAATPALETAAQPPRLGRAQLLRAGADITLVACGPYPVRYALEAADVLAAEGLEAAVLNMHTVKPLDTAALADARAVVTVEEHWRGGGLGGAVAEALGPRGVRVARVGVEDTFVSESGSHTYLLGRAGLSPGAVAEAARSVR
ncbi:transketolase C-terminal domain-containing protein [Streptomyces sp. NPDC006638]|uniref:transketolase family protein n=1 Tax=unclassified Streptomyces TaxID=2593676 RepID=UPI0033A1C801